MTESLDHIVLSMRDIDAAAFYARVLGMRTETFGKGRTALHFGNRKITSPPPGREICSHACTGSGDPSLITRLGSDPAVQHLLDEGVEIIEGPVRKTGALGPISSACFNDPDGNLIEVAS